jgi:hypothetical protein
MTNNLSVNFHTRWWVRPIAASAAILGFLLCLVAPKTGERFTQAVIRRIVRVGLVVG